MHSSVLRRHEGGSQYLQMGPRGSYVVNPNQPPQWAQANLANINQEVNQPIGDIHEHLNARHDARNRIERWRNERHEEEVARRRQYDQEFGNPDDAPLPIVLPNADNAALPIAGDLKGSSSFTARL